MANQGKSQSGSAGHSSDERNEGNQDRNRPGQGGQSSGNQGQSGTKPGTTGGMNQGGSSNRGNVIPEDRSQADGDSSDSGTERLRPSSDERGRRETDAD